jgi:hypothetical protein
MSAPVIPPPLEALRNRPFSFYPAILNIEHNQWHYRKATWSEALVVNARTGQEIWIARHYLGEISSIEDPVVIVGLLKELEYKGGAVWPYQRRVIEMPLAVGESRPAAGRRTGPAPVVGIRLEPRGDSHIFRFVGGALVAGIVAAYFVVNLCRESLPHTRATYHAKMPAYLGLTSRDGYGAVVRRLGAPANDRQLDASSGAEFRALAYPARGCTIILRGLNGQPPTYIGAFDTNWHPVHWVPLAQGDAELLLRDLKRF